MRTGNDKGYTLMELMIVVAIISISVTIAIPNYLKMMPHLRLKAAVRDVESALQLARMTAISNNQTVEVSFDLTGNTFVYRHINSSEWRDVLMFEPNVALTAGTPKFTDNKVKFKSNGTADMSDAQQAVYLQNIRANTKNEKYRVVVVKVNGIIKIERYTGSAWVSG